MQKTAYDLRISDWSSDVCASDLAAVPCVEIRWNERKLPWLEIIGTFDCRFLLLGCVRGLVRAAARLLTTVVVAIRSSRRRDWVSCRRFRFRAALGCRSLVDRLLRGGRRLGRFCLISRSEYR